MRWLLAWFLIAFANAALAQSVEDQTEALSEDAQQYAAQFAVTPDEALRRLKVQQSSVGVTDALAVEFADRLAGISFEHSPSFRIVVLLTGTEPVAERSVENVPIVFRTGAKATHAQALEALRKHLIDFHTDLPNARGAGYDQRSGEIVLLVTPEDAQRLGVEAIRGRAEEVGGVPVRVVINALEEADMSVDGGGRVEGLNLATNRRNLCTTAFVVTNGETTAITTAAHCPDELTYVDRDGITVRLPMIGSWGAAYRDVQINGTPDSPEPLFYSTAVPGLCAASSAGEMSRARARASTSAIMAKVPATAARRSSSPITRRPETCAAARAHRPGSPSEARAASRATAEDRFSVERSPSA